MFRIIILGFSLYSSHCHQVNEDIITRSQSEPSQNSNYNYGPSQNSNHYYDYNINSNNNYEPSQNSNDNYRHSHNSRKKPEFDLSDSQRFITWGDHGQYKIPVTSEGLDYPTTNITRLPYANQEYYDQTDNYSGARPINYNIHKQYNGIPAARYYAIGGQPVPEFMEYPKQNQRNAPSIRSGVDDKFSLPERIAKYFSAADRYSAQIGGTAVPELPEFREYPKQLLDVYGPLRKSLGGISPQSRYPISSDLRDRYQSEKLVRFGGVQSRTNEIMSAKADYLGVHVPRFPEEEDFSWQVSVFSKEVTPHARVCGGTLVTSSAVISVLAAQCFWGLGPLPAELFAVAAGKASSGQDIYESYHYQSNVSGIALPARFRGAAHRLQEDIAVLQLETPLAPWLRPACVGRDWTPEQQARGVGTVLGNEKDRYAPVLVRHHVSYMDVESCVKVVPEDQLPYFTSDKFCAGFRGEREPAICSYDIGSGLVYYSDSVPFLRSVASRLLGASCVTAFTDVAAHRAFLLRHVDGLEACERRYTLGRPEESKEEVMGEEGNTFVCNCYC